MKRGGPLTRRTPLKPGRGLAPGKGLQRGTEPLRRSAPIARTPMVRKPASKPAPAARKTGASPEVRALVISRDEQRCQRCGAPGANLHHRTPRAMGGTSDPASNRPPNLVSLCGTGTTGCHGLVESKRAEALSEGWLVRHGVDAAAVPVLTYLGLRLLTDDGRSIGV